MKKLIFYFLLIVNTLSAQENSITELINTPQNGDFNIAITNIDSKYHLTTKESVNFKNGSSVLKMIYKESETSNELKASEFRFIDSLNSVLVNVYADRQLNENEKLINDTLFFNLSEDHVICDVFAFSDNGLIFDYMWTPGGEDFLVLPHGTYDFMTRYMLPDIKHVFISNYEFNNKDTLTFYSDEAIYEIDLKPVGINGDTLPNSSALIDFLYYNYQTLLGYTANIIVESYANVNTKYYFSNNQDNTEINFSNSYCDQPGENEINFVDYKSLTQIVNDTVLSNNPDDYISGNIKYKLLDHNNAQKSFYFGHESAIKYIDISGNIDVNFPIIVTFSNTKTGSYWKGKIHYWKYGNQNLSLCNTNYLVSKLNNNDAEINTKTNLIDIINDSVSNYYTLSPLADVVAVAENDSLYAGLGTSIPWLKIRSFYAELSVDGYWYGSAHEEEYPVNNSQLYEIIDENGHVIQSGNGCSIYTLLEPGTYSIKFTNNHNEFDNFTGISEGKFTFNTTLSDFRPPAIRPIQFRDGSNTIRHIFNAEDDINLFFAAADFYDYHLNHIGIKYHQINQKKTVVKIKEHQQSEWQETISNSIYQDSLIGDLYKSNLSSFVTNDSALYDIQIKIEDSVGNSAIYSFYPAFAVADFSTKVEQEENKYSEEIFQIFPNPATNTLNIKLLKENTSAKVKIINALGKIVNVFDMGQTNKSIDLTGFSNGVYFISVNNGKNSSIKKFIKK